MKHDEARETLEDEEKEIIGRGFGKRGNKSSELFLRSSALQEMATEDYYHGATILGQKIGKRK